MLSICVPVYNYDICELINILNKQCQACNIPYEINVYDDFSDTKYRNKNRSVIDLNRVNYVELSENYGRSKIRNLLAKKSKYTHLLFLDCDSQIPDDDFIKRYLPYCLGGVVVCGGRNYPERLTLGNKYRLHWLYGSQRESLSLAVRANEPNKSFMTNNFLISRDVLKNIHFNEQLLGYGHEDTLFGYELKKQNIQITHIDNPVIHKGLETSTMFLRKTNEAVVNLWKIAALYNFTNDLVNDITLLKWYFKLKKYHMHLLVAILFKMTKPLLKYQLLSNKPDLNIFSFYKLGYLCEINFKSIN